MVGKPIFPMAYKIKPNQVRTIYYLGFPISWKENLIKLKKMNKPNFKSEYGLSTHTLQKMVDSWMEGIVSMSILKENSDDSHWLASTLPFDEKRISILLEIIRVWIMATYVSMPKTNPSAALLAKEMCATIKVDEFYALRSEKEIILSTPDGCVSSEAYQAIPLIVVNKLVGQDIEINGTQIHLLYAAKNELVSNVIIEPKSGHKYSFVFKFSVQTTPPQREALLLCDISIRRWIYSRKNKEKAPFLKNSIVSHIKVSDDKFCQIPIQYNSATSSLEWKRQDKECYNLYGYNSLPSINDLWTIIENGNNNYILPYTNGMIGFVTSKIGTGVPVKDKAAAYEKILSILVDIVDSPCIPERISSRQKLNFYKSPQEYGTREEFRQWVVSCAETNKIRFELYGILSNSVHQSLLDAISDKILCDFGNENENSCLSIDIIKKEIGNIANPIGKYEKVQRCDEIKEELGETDDVVACICIIPDANEYKDGEDPKLIIRNAFARSGRVVQFVVAPDEIGALNSHKIEHAVYDMYRQLGITTLIDTKRLKSYKLRDVSCIGMHVCTQIHGIKNKARFLPLYVSHDLLTGRSSVQCTAFEETSVNYRKACIEMAKLFWNENLEQLCVNASFSPAKQKLLEMKNRFDCENKNAVLLIHSDGNTRQLWGGISDKAISEYNETSDYIPEKIDVGTIKTSYPISLTGTGVRVFRVRNNAEVPDYYTSQHDKDENYSSASGIFKYGKVFWAIAVKPNDTKYNRSLKDSRFNNPFANYAEKDMIEIYPIQLQINDDPSVWTKYITDLCSLSIQYNQSTSLPLPLHLAVALEEYLLEI